MHGEGLILFTAAHELVHTIREGSPEQFKALADFLIDNYVKKGVDVQTLVKREMLGRGTNLTYNEAYEEMIAESCESFLRDIYIGDKSQELYKQNPTLWGKIKNALSRIVDAVKEWYRKASPQSMEGRITSRSDTKTLEKAYQLFIDAVQSSAENLRNMEKAADKVGMKLQPRYAKQGGKFANALTKTEWGIFHSSVMQGNQRNSFRIGNDGIVLHGDKFSKVVYYEDVDGDLEVKAVYKVENYEYNIHDKSPNAFDALIKLERNEIDEGDARAILGNCELLFGSVFKKYNTHTGKYIKHSRSSYKSTSTNKTQSNGTGVSGGAQQTGSVKYQSRGGDFFDIDDMFDDDDSIESTFAKEYATHHEDIGEVLRNIADIEIDPKKVTSIVNRVIRDNFGSIDTKARELLSTEIQIALENVNREDPETVINEMINAVRKAVVDANVTDDRAAANYRDLLSAFKGNKYYLTDEQAQICRHKPIMVRFSLPYPSPFPAPAGRRFRPAL